MDILQDMLIEILKWLPVKSLLQFRSVSKSWLRLIDSDNFVKSHLAVSRLSNSRLFYKKPCYGQQKFFVNHISVKSLLLGQLQEQIDNEVAEVIDYHHVHSWVGSCNGLICYFCLLTSSSICCYIRNPSTRETKQLDSSFMLPSDIDRTVFGFDESSKDYKVVVIMARHICVYSLRLDLWKRIDSLDDSNLLCLNPKFLKGKIYWLRLEDNLGLHDLVWFDLGTETHGSIELSMHHHLSTRIYWSLNVFGDRIYVGSGVGIWLLNEKTNRWDELLRIRLHVSEEEEAFKKLGALATENGIFEIYGIDFLVSLDGSLSSDSMVMIMSSGFIPIIKWEESLIRLNQRRIRSTN